jgi:AcrR family transcriptional regulator
VVTSGTEPGAEAVEPPPLGRRERKKLEVRRRIIDAAETLFAAQGVAATTVDQIGDLADVSQTTFFNHFSTKAGLIDALVAELVVLFDGILERSRDTGATVAQTVHALFHASAELTEVQHRLLREIIAETARTSSPAARASLTQMREGFTDYLAAGQQAGQVRGDREAHLLADAVLGLYIAVFLFWTTAADYPVAERLREVTGMAIDLIAPSPLT